MNILRKISMGTILCSLIITHIAADTNQQDNNPFTPTPLGQAAFNPSEAEAEQLKKVSDDTQRIRVIITALVQKFQTTNALDAANKKNIVLWTLPIQQFLQNVQTVPDNSAVNFNLKNKVHEHIITILQHAVTSTGKELPEFAPELIIKKCLAPTTAVDTAQLAAQAASNQAALTDLEYKVRNIGLSKVNKIARNIEAYGKKFKLISLFKWVGVLGGLGWLAHKILRPKTEQSTTLPVPTPEEQSIKLNELVTNVSIGALGHAGVQMGHAVVQNGRDMVFEKWNSLKHGSYVLWNKLKGQSSVLDESGYKIVDSKLTFASDELIGLEEQIKQISPILDCAMDLEGFVSRGNKPQYGTLLIGPSGCGKTQFSRALSGTIRQIFDVAGKSTQVSFREINCWEFRFSTLRTFISEARKQGGVVVLFIDEIHNLNMQTTRDTSALNEFLTQMADLYNSEDPNSHVFLIAATNEPQLLGSSLLVPGRFGKIIYFDYPNATKRQQLFKTLLPKSGINPDDIDIASLVRQTNQYVSFGKLREIINEARIKASSKNELVTQQHLQSAVDTIVHRFTLTIELTPEEKRRIAVYQAGKAVAHQALESHKILERVTIGGINREIQEKNEFNGAVTKDNPNKSRHYQPIYGAVITSDMNETLPVDNQKEQEKQSKMLLAGALAQDMILGTHSTAYQLDDKKEALQIAQKIVLDGRQLDQLSKKRQEQVKEEAELLLERYQQDMVTLLQPHHAAIEKVTQALEEKIILSGNEIQELLS